jgi:hypothetical protein
MRRIYENNSSASKPIDFIQEVSDATNSNDIIHYYVFPKFPWVFGAVNNTAKACPYHSRTHKHCTGEE